MQTRDDAKAETVEKNLDILPADNATGSLKPHAVTIKVARRLLADKARSEIYKAVHRGDLDAIKDGVRTLITLASIESYMTRLPPAKFQPLRRARRQSRGSHAQS